MNAVISTTFDDRYFFFIPITTYCWHKLGVNVTIFYPGQHGVKDFLNSISEKHKLVVVNCAQYGFVDWEPFECPEHKEATYAQCSRLYAAALDLPEDEVLITSDIDMALFKIPQNAGSHISIFGHDLVPPKQVPICYISADVSEWRRLFKINGRTYQQCLDDILGHIEAEHFRGNYWGKDQEEAHNNIFDHNGHAVLLPRARPGTQFATNRLDRDDAYLLERLNPDIVDYHMPRPGYEDAAFNQILTVLKYFYPTDSFQWLIDYREQYIRLL